MTLAQSATGGVISGACLHCGQPIKGVRSSRRYCDDACRAKFNRGKKHPHPPRVESFDDLPAHLKKFTPGDPEDCWIWEGRRGSLGYAPGTSVKGYKGSAYRLIYLMLVGPVPEGQHLDHLCDNGPGGCVNHHLNPTTPKENILRSKNACAEKARQTHCSKGHEFTPENTTVVQRRNGHASRICRTCQDERQRRYYEKTGADELNRKRREKYAENAARVRAQKAEYKRRKKLGLPTGRGTYGEVG